MRNKPYYKLFIFDSGHWFDDFGSYDKEEVEGEREYARDHHKAKHLKIIKLANGTTTVLLDALKTLNGE
jgi:hypothetical protein